MVSEHLAAVLQNNGLITAFLLTGTVFLLSDIIATRLTRGRIHSSAVAIFLGLLAAWIGGAVAGGTNGLADMAAFSGLGILGGAWYNDNVQTFTGKEAAEQLRSAWIVEIPEIDRFSAKYESSAVKQFITRQQIC